MSVVDDSFDHPMKLEERASMSLAGGLMQQGYQCGMLWGAALAAGAQAYRLHGPGPVAETEAVNAAQQLANSFRIHNKHIDCFDITELQWNTESQSDLAKQVFKFFIKGGPIHCFRMAAKYAPISIDDINTSFSESQVEALSPPVSCASVLAQKMGASELHTVMSAGLAGGIGLSGGACGAFGAAIWIIGMNSGMEEAQGMDFAPPGANDAMERFLEAADYEFECSKIVGRKFESINDHAEFLHTGGCSEIIKALASE